MKSLLLTNSGQFITKEYRISDSIIVNSVTILYKDDGNEPNDDNTWRCTLYSFAPDRIRRFDGEVEPLYHTMHRIVQPMQLFRNRNLSLTFAIEMPDIYKTMLD